MEHDFYIGGVELKSSVKSEMTLTMTKEQILTKHGVLNRELFIKDVSTIHLQISKEKYDSCLNAMSEWESQQLYAERERAGKLVEVLRHCEYWMSACISDFVVPIHLYTEIKQTLNKYDTATKES